MCEEEPERIDTENGPICWPEAGFDGDVTVVTRGGAVFHGRLTNREALEYWPCQRVELRPKDGHLTQIDLREVIALTF